MTILADLCSQEIAIRVFRTAHELAMHTVAIYSNEDRMSAHRQRADEAYQVGAGLTPVAAYLAQDDIVRIALEHGVDMIHPGYGFLSENASFARKVEEAGIAFIGPTPEVIDGLGDKTKARTIGMIEPTSGIMPLLTQINASFSCGGRCSCCTRYSRPGRVVH